MPDSFPVLDTHTGGEITRVVLGTEIGLSVESCQEILGQLNSRLDWVRRSLTSEPRGSEFAVGALVWPPSASRRSGVIVFFNNVGYLGMCGHGLIGVVEALRHQGLINVGDYEFETPAGMVTATLLPDRQVRFTGVDSYCFRQDVSVTLDDGSQVVGDIGYGGNWFYLTAQQDLSGTSIDRLMIRSQQIRDALDRDKICGADAAVIDHVELYDSLSDGDSTSSDPVSGCRNFVLCPGGHYDRSPCGTGTSAKLACLAARCQLAPDQLWIQESITGSRFTAYYRSSLAGDTGVRVTITGRAHVLAETVQVYDPADPLRWGIGVVQR